MKDTAAALLLVIWAIVISPILIGMGWSKNVYVDQIEIANKWCEPHGGLAVIDGTTFQDWLPDTSFKCKDGTRMSLTLAREKKK